jgi:hypothetical protein
MNSTCQQLYNEIEAMYYLTRIEKDALIDENLKSLDNYLTYETLKEQ